MKEEGVRERSIATDPPEAVLHRVDVDEPVNADRLLEAAENDEIARRREAHHKRVQHSNFRTVMQLGEEKTTVRQTDDVVVPSADRVDRDGAFDSGAFVRDDNAVALRQHPLVECARSGDAPVDKHERFMCIVRVTGDAPDAQ